VYDGGSIIQWGRNSSDTYQQWTDYNGVDSTLYLNVGRV
jgi:hypothetical protein